MGKTSSSTFNAYKGRVNEAIYEKVIMCYGLWVNVYTSGESSMCEGIITFFSKISDDPLAGRENF